MQKSIGALFAVLFSLSAAGAEPEFCGEKFTTLEALEAVIRAKPGIEVLTTNGSVNSYSDPATTIIWNFATEANPAFPSVACRRLVEDGGAYYVKTEIKCGAAKAECDRLAASYDELDRKMREAVEKEKR